MKKGEIVFNDKGDVVEVNGYDGNRKSFEYIELSKYYSVLERMEMKLIQAEMDVLDIRNLIRELT